MRLKVETSPGQFNQGRTDTPIAMLGNGPAPRLGATGPDARTHPGQAGHLATVLKAVPVENLPFQDLAGQGTHSANLRLGRRFKRFGGSVQLCLYGQQELTEGGQKFQQRWRQLILE